jgi:RNase P subunit RPR2
VRVNKTVKKTFCPHCGEPLLIGKDHLFCLVCQYERKRGKPAILCRAAPLKGREARRGNKRGAD